MEKMTREKKTQYLLSELHQMAQDNGGILKTAQITGAGADYRRILAWVGDGTLRRVRNGYYAFAETKQSEEEMILGLFPDAVLCMESALYCHGYLGQRPYHWHLAVDKNTSKSRFHMEYPSVVPYYTEPEVLRYGVTTIPFAGRQMQIYTKERTICDCLRFEEKLDRDVFRRALLAYIADGSKDVASLLETARQRRVLQKVHNRIGVWL